DVTSILASGDKVITTKGRTDSGSTLSIRPCSRSPCRVFTESSLCGFRCRTETGAQISRQPLLPSLSPDLLYALNLGYATLTQIDKHLSGEGIRDDVEFF